MEAAHAKHQKQESVSEILPLFNDWTQKGLQRQQQRQRCCRRAVGLVDTSALILSISHYAAESLI